jgi:hypothetical protein
MQILKGSKREITLMQWNEKLEKARKRLRDSEEVFRRFGDNQHWVEKDRSDVEEIEEDIRKVIEFMDKHGIK